MKTNEQAKPNPHSAQGPVLSSTPVYPSGLRGYTGRALLSQAMPASVMPGRFPLPGILLKRGFFGGSRGASPGLNLITLQHRKSA
jgi:hypothetical protein